MHFTTALLPLLVFAATVVAAPTPLHPAPRRVPMVHEVIRNPAPIDSRVAAKVNLLGTTVGVDIHTRGVPKVEANIDDPSTIV
jgi:hypothetical protein